MAQRGDNFRSRVDTSDGEELPTTRTAAGVPARAGHFIANQFRLRRSEASPSPGQHGQVGRGREGRFKEL